MIDDHRWRYSWRYSRRPAICLNGIFFQRLLTDL